MNLKSRKIISMALVFFMMLTILPLAPVTAFAAGKTTVTQIELTGVHLPKVGNPCSTKDEAGVTTPSDAAYEFPPQYYGYWDADGNKLTSAQKFEPGRQYYTQILVTIKGDFKDTHAFSAGSEPTIIFTDIDKSLYKNYSVSFRYIEDDSLRAIISFTMAGDNAYAPINTLVLDDYKTPVNGQTLYEWYSDSNAPEYNNSKMTSLKYLMPDGTEYYGNAYHKTMYTQVETGKKYGLEMKFKAVEEYTFADVVNISVASGNPTITYDVSDDKKTMTVKLMEEAPGPDITSIEFGLISQAAVINGNTVEKYADYWVTESSDKYYAYFNAYWYEWKDEAGNIVTGQKFENGKKYIGKFDFRAETGHSFADDVAINITSGGKYVSHKVTGYSGSRISLEVTVTPHIPLNFVNQSPTGSDGKTTGLNVMTDVPQTYTFNSTPAPAGFYVEKTATLKGLFADLDFGDSVKTITPVTDGSAATLKHTFSKAGLYQLTETLKLYKEGEATPVETKTHVFLISVSEKPAVVPEITQQPEDATKVIGSHELSATAKNADRARWYKIGSDGNLNALDTSFSAGVATTTISSNTPGDRYYCAFWSVDNKIAQTDVVTVCFAPTVIAGETVTVSPGGKAFLRVTENGCNHYDAESGWYAPGSSVEVSGDKYYTMGTTLAIQNVDTSDAGIYTYKYVTHGETVTGTVKLVVEAPAAAEYIDTFEIYIDEPIFGKTAPTTATVPSGVEYKVKEIKWTSVNSDNIITGSSPYAQITLEKTGTKQFKSQYSSGNLIGSVNGLTATVYGCDTAKDEITVTIMYNAPGTSRKVIMPEPDSVSVTTEKLTFEKDKEYTASDNMKITGTFACDHNDLAEDYQHTGMIYSLESTTDNNAMPTGLTLNQNGSITGTPTAAGTYTVVILAHSANGNNTPSTGSGHVVKAIEIIVESDAHTHDWDYENPDSDSVTCTADGEKVISCKNGCSEKITVTSPATGHDWGEWSTYMVPTCKDDPITITRTCKKDSSHTESATINGIHMGMYWTTDENYHWKVCVYCHEAIVYQPELHADTNSDNKCDICEYDMTPVHEHTYATEWSKDETHHWYASTCGHDVGAKAEHVYDNSKDAECNVCKYTRTISSGSSSGGGFSGSYNYPVIVGDTDGADVTVSDDYAVKGEKITITVKPDAGEQVDEVIVTDKDGKVIPVTKTGDNEYTFTMPASKVTVDVATEAADYGLRIVMQINNKNILVNGKTMVNDVAPVIVGDRTLVPIRVVTELLGGSADWDNATRTVTLKIDGKTMNMTIGKEIPGFGTSAVIMNDRTYVPVRYVMEKLGAEVEWIGATRQIIIEK